MTRAARECGEPAGPLPRGGQAHPPASYDSGGLFPVVLGKNSPRATLWDIFVPFCSTLCIVLNIYNGDILPIDENLEYALWYVIPFCAGLRGKTGRQLARRYHVFALGVCVNLYWYWASPFKSGRSLRHRTEYYDTQCLLCSLLYQQLAATLLGVHEGT